MAIVTPSPRVESTPSPQALSPTQAPRRLTRRRGLLTWAGVLTGLAAAVALAVAAVSGDDDNPTVNLNGAGAPASEHSVDGAGD